MRRPLAPSGLRISSLLLWSALALPAGPVAAPDQPGAPTTRTAPADAPARPDAHQVAHAKTAPAFRSPDGRATIRLLLEPRGDAAAYVGLGTFLPGAYVPAHRHEGSEEIVYIVSGRGTMTLGPELLEVAPGMAFRIPPGVEHSFRVVGDRPVEVIQVYNPGGPEQRFREWQPVSEDR